MPFRPARWAAMMLVLSTSASAAATLGTRDLKLLESSPAGVRFEATMPEAQWSKLTTAAGGEAAMRVELDGYGTSEAPGEPALPTRVVVVAVPPVGGVSVSGLGLDETTRDGVEVATTPWLGGESPEPTPARAGALSCARLLDVSWMRHQRVARIELRPAWWDPAARRVHLYGRIAVSVDVVPTPTASAAPSADAFESVYRNLLVNYEQGRGWRAPPSGRPPATGRTGLAAASVAQATTLPDTSLFVGRRWIKIAVRRSGFYRLPFSRFKGLAPFANDTTIASDSLRLYTWAGFPVMPEGTYCDSCGYSEVALGIVDDDGRMNHTGDAIYFYALGSSDWSNRYDPTLPDTLFINHPYETRNFYYLGVSTATQPLPGIRRRIATRDAAPSGGAVPTPATFPERVHREADLVYDANLFPSTTTYFWDKWFWTKVANGGSFSASTDAPGADTTQTSGVARLRARMWSKFKGGDCLDQRQFIRVTWDQGNPGTGTFGWRGYRPYTLDTPVDSLHAKGNDLKITMDLRCNNEVAVSWFDLFYSRRYEPMAEKLEFRAPVGGGLQRYQIAPFQGATPPRLFDITDPMAPVEVTGATYSAVTGGSQLAFESNDPATERYVVLPDTSFLDVPTTDLSGAASTSLDNLRSHTQNADYVVIYYDEFQEAADTLTAWRRAYNGFRTKTVPISAIYDQFSGGRTDPTAIRNFLRAAYFNWTTQPAYVTFLGDASYDFKNISGLARPGQPGCPLPTFENGYDTSSQLQYTTDDWLTNVDDPTVIIPDFLIGRIPVTSASVAMDVVRNKVLSYERSAPLGSYRDRVMLIADDNQQGGADDDLHWTHLAQTTLLDQSYTPNNFDRDYVYLHTFPYPGPTNFTKPGAHTAILNTLDGDGAFLVNYIGHGSPFKLADESVFLTADADNLSNANRLPLFIAASCDVGKFSDPANPSLGEHLVVRSGGGAIGMISATDPTYSTLNGVTNDQVYRGLFSRDSAQGELSGEVAKALLQAKVLYAGPNSQKYQLMGDAALRLNLPRYWVGLDLKDDAGLDTTAIQQGRRLSFSGRVLSGPNGSLVPIDGTADVLIEDSAPILRAPPCTLSDCTPTPTYVYRAGPIYRGSAEVRGGLLSGRFMVPLEARPGTRGRIRVYLTGTPTGSAVSRDAVGDLKLRVATGTAPSGDQEGPKISLSFPGGATRVRPDATLRIDLSDSSGILITSHTPQNGIIVTIDGNTTSRVEVTDSFKYSPGSFQAGTATFPLPTDRPLPEGLHVIGVSAADNLAVGLSAGQHRSQASIEFEVAQAPPLRIVDAYLFPDPTGSYRGPTFGGQFVVDTEGGPVDVQLRIYTVSGRLLRRLSKQGGEGQVQLRWDGLDAEGQGLANGVYLFKVVVTPTGADAGAGGDREADVQGRFVVLNP